MTEAAFNNQIYSQRDKLFRLAKRILFDAQWAEDTIQDVLTKLWIKRDTLDKYNNIEVVAMVAVKNRCFDELKKKKRRLKHHDAKSLQMSTTDTRTLRKVEANSQLTMVNKIMNELPEQQRIILQLRDIEGMNFNEIANTLSLQEGTIRTNLSRARKRVREQLIKANNYGLDRN